MGIKAQNQVTLIDITDAYSVILSNENQTFRETSYNSGVVPVSPATETTVTTTVYSYRGSTNVYAYLPSSAIGSTHANTDGVYLTVESPATNPAQDLEITIHIPSGLTATGSIEIPIELYETNVTTGEPLTTFTKEFSYSVARYGQTGAQGSSPTIYDLQYTGTLFNFDNEAGQYTAPATITVTATSQTGTDAAAAYTGGTITVTPYTATGTAGAVSTSSTSVTITPTVENGAPKYIYYLATLTVGGNIVDKQTIGTTRQGADGEDSYSIDITSSNGFVFKNSNTAVTLTAHVYKGGVELNTSDLTALSLGVFWYEGATKKNNAPSLTLQVAAGAVVNLMHLTAKLEDYTYSS